MQIKNTIVQAALDYAQARLPQQDVVAAGGCVRDALLGAAPKDIDLFVLNIQPAQFEAARMEFQKQIALDVITPPQYHKSEPYLLFSANFEGVTLQLMATPWATGEQLLKSFDWNVCLFSYNGRLSTQHESPQNIGPGKELWLRRITFPRSTLRRGFRFAERFGMRINELDLNRLCAAVVVGSLERRHKQEISGDPKEPA